MMKLCCALLCLIVFQGCVKQPEPKLRPEAAQKLLKLRGYEFDERSFHNAVRANDRIAIFAFIDGGINVNSQDETDGRTVLMNAVVDGDPGFVSLLLNRGADVNVKDHRGYTALFHAIETRNDYAEKMLLDHPNLDPDARGLNGITALSNYIWRDNKDAVERLLERGADVNSQDNDGDAPLHGAAQIGNVEIVDLLIDKGADPNLKNKQGGTPLMWAAVYGNEDAARWLLEHGADASLKDAQGFTAGDWAVKNKREKLVVLLQRSR